MRRLAELQSPDAFRSLAKNWAQLELPDLLTRHGFVRPAQLAPPSGEQHSWIYQTWNSLPLFLLRAGWFP